MRHKKDTQILSKWNDTDFKLYAKTNKKIFNRNELKGEEQEETVEFFLIVYYSYSFVTLLLLPAAMPSEMATMISGRPTHIERKEIETPYCMTTLDLAIRKHGDSYKCMF